MHDPVTCTYDGYSKVYRSNISETSKNTIDRDCEKYAKYLREDTEVNLDDSVPIINMISAIDRVSDVAVGHSYYIKYGGTVDSTNREVQRVWAPWKIGKLVKKHMTHFHVATVVAKDGNDVITSEVNSAFEEKQSPWFGLYTEHRNFYKSFKIEYRGKDRWGRIVEPLLLEIVP